MKERGKVWKDYMEWIMNDESDWDHNVEGDAVEGGRIGVPFGMPYTPKLYYHHLYHPLALH